MCMDLYEYGGFLSHGGTPKSSILVGFFPCFSTVNHSAVGVPPFQETSNSLSGTEVDKPKWSFSNWPSGVIRSGWLILERNKWRFIHGWFVIKIRTSIDNSRYIYNNNNNHHHHNNKKKKNNNNIMYIYIYIIIYYIYILYYIYYIIYTIFHDFPIKQTCI